MKNIVITLIRAYRYAISPLLPQSCRFAPTCSEYSIEALNRYGTVKGMFLTIRRILKCHPFHPGGFDPVK